MSTALCRCVWTNRKQLSSIESEELPEGQVPRQFLKESTAALRVTAVAPRI